MTSQAGQVTFLWKLGVLIKFNNRAKFHLHSICSLGDNWGVDQNRVGLMICMGKMKNSKNRKAVLDKSRIFPYC